MQLAVFPDEDAILDAVTAGDLRVAVVSEAPLLHRMSQRNNVALLRDNSRPVQDPALRFFDRRQGLIPTTVAEHEWLARHPVVRVGIDPQ